jgi:hypothetical protein
MSVHSNKYTTTTVDIIRTIIMVDIMPIEHTDMVVGIIIETESTRRADELAENGGDAGVAV